MKSYLDLTFSYINTIYDFNILNIIPYNSIYK